MVLSAKATNSNKSRNKSQNVVNLFNKGPQKKGKKKKYKVRGPAIVFAALLGFIIYSFSGQLMEIYKVKSEINNIRTQMNDLQNKNSDLKNQVEQLQSNAYIEREAREKLGLVKPGEKIILEAKPGSVSQPILPQKNQENVDIH